MTDLAPKAVMRNHVEASTAVSEAMSASGISLHQSAATRNLLVVPQPSTDEEVPLPE
ncbi:hypothetical protein [Phyllobacterium endophyticum]|uniref:hypothetical protein n=1 Tax=Phyllobacterium endophyticum TaxID=1149773 RepID=UPI00164FA217|nr:hypothetical protein [Phyllobacterium endophyticum]